ncbi:hypothetical protein ACH9EU_08315 [Kocuria sp. M1R5S2]|uniref:hypothetical protein n=1 Tax=Kocuria rhizosphaerae TaxID=3376285 RepID=UPI00378AE581
MEHYMGYIINSIESPVGNYLEFEAAEFSNGKVDGEKLKKARDDRDTSLPQTPWLTGRSLARVRDIFVAHDSRIDKILAEANPASGDDKARLQKLHQALESRILVYLHTLRALSVALNLPLSKRSTNSNVSAEDSRLAYVDEVAVYVDDVTELLEGGTPASWKQAVLALRVKTDLALNILEMPNPQANQRLIRRHLADYDNTIDALITTTAIAEESIDSGTLNHVRGLFADRLKNEAKSRQLWLQVWVAGSALGLLAIVLAFRFSLFDAPGWSWITVCLAGLGALVAALYTFRATRGMSVRGNWILVALPVLVLVIAVVLPRQDGQTLVSATAVAILTVAVLGGMSLWVVRHEPDEPPLRSGLSSRSLGLLRGSASSESETTDWDCYLVADEITTLRARILQEAGKQRKASIAWATTFILVGGVAALLSGAAGVTANLDQGNALIVGLAIGGAGLTALMTALNPGRRWEQARALHLACQSLEQEVGVLIRLDLGGNEPKDDNGRQKIEEIAKMYDALLGVPERPRLWRDIPAAEREK